MLLIIFLLVFNRDKGNREVVMCVYLPIFVNTQLAVID